MDIYARHCAFMRKIYGADCPLPTREGWDAACKQARMARTLTADEFDDNQFSEENGDGAIY